MRVAVIVAGLAPWLIAGFQELSRKKKHVHGEDEYGEGIYEALRERTGSFQQVYGIVGHTHRMDIQELGTLTRCPVRLPQQRLLDASVGRTPAGPER